MAAGDAKTEPPASGSGFTLAVGWAYVIGSTQQIVALIVSFTMARILGVEEFGVFALANLAQLFAGLLVRNGLTGAMIHREQFDRVAQSTSFILLLGLSTITGLLMAALAPFYSALNGDPPDLTIVTQVMLLTLPVSAFGAMQNVTLRRDLRFKEMTPPVVIGVVSGGAVAVVMALLDFGIWALVGQHLTMVTVSAIGQFRVAGWRPTRDYDGAVARDLLGFTGGTLLSTIAEFVRNRSDTVIVGAALSPVAVGIFRFAGRFGELAMEFSIRALQGAVLPGLARLQHDAERLSSRILQTYRVGAILATFPVLVVFTAVGPILEIVGAEKWGASANAMRILAIAVLFQAIATLTAPTLQAVGRPYAFAGLAWVQAAVTVIVLIPLTGAVPDWSLADQVAAVAAARCVINIISVSIEVTVVARVCSVSRAALVVAIAPPLLGATAAGGFAWFLSDRLDLNVWIDAAMQGTVIGLALLVVVAADPAARRMVQQVVPDRFFSRG